MICNRQLPFGLRQLGIGAVVIRDWFMSKSRHTEVQNALSYLSLTRSSGGSLPASRLMVSEPFRANHRQWGDWRAGLALRR
jgi:hypothetical protein